MKLYWKLLFNLFFVCVFLLNHTFTIYFWILIIIKNKCFRGFFVFCLQMFDFFIFHWNTAWVPLIWQRIKTHFFVVHKVMDTQRKLKSKYLPLLRFLISNSFSSHTQLRFLLFFSKGNVPNLSNNFYEGGICERNKKVKRGILLISSKAKKCTKHIKVN